MSHSKEVHSNCCEQLKQFLLTIKRRELIRYHYKWEHNGLNESSLWVQYTRTRSSSNKPVECHLNGRCQRCSFLLYIDSKAYSDIYAMDYMRCMHLNLLLQCMGPFSNYSILRELKRDDSAFTAFFQYNALQYLAPIPFDKAMINRRKIMLRGSTMDDRVVAINQLTSLFRFCDATCRRVIKQNPGNMNLIMRLLADLFGTVNRVKVDPVDREKDTNHFHLIHRIFFIFGHDVPSKFKHLYQRVFPDSNGVDYTFKELSNFKVVADRYARYELIFCANKECGIGYLEHKYGVAVSDLKAINSWMRRKSGTINQSANGLHAKDVGPCIIAAEGVKRLLGIQRIKITARCVES